MPPKFSKKAFEILEFNSNNLAKALSNKYCSMAKAKQNQRFRYFMNYLTSKEVNVQTIIVENDYTDGDYLDDYSNYYVKSFRSYERRCKRIHLFSTIISKEHFMSILLGQATKSEIKKFKKAYKGYIIARPLSTAIIGRTALATYKGRKGGRRHYTCVKECKVNLFGIELAVQSLEYQEQDKVLAACATVALWCCFHQMNELFQTPVLTPAAITRLANEVVHNTRAIPSQGLMVGQINNAINRNALVAEIIHVDSSTPILHLLYGYLKFGLPVILGVNVQGKGLHAITLVGYSIGNKPSVLMEETSELIPFTADRIEKFYAHDDQIVPFARITVKPSQEYANLAQFDDALLNGKAPSESSSPVAFESSWEDDDKYLLTMYPKVIIVPLYNKIRINFIDVQDRLLLFNTFLKSGSPSGEIIDSTKAVWDLYLTTNNKLKSAIKINKKSEALKSTLTEQHPRFIWHAVLSINNERSLELFADATDTPGPFLFYKAVWHSLSTKKKIIQSIKVMSKKALEEFFSDPFLELLCS